MTERSRRFGPYLVQGELGRGGGGVVYRAVHGRTGATVAVKTVEVPEEPVLRALRREFYVLSAVRHPSIVPVVDEGLEETRPWYAMELLPGETLLPHVRRRWDPDGARRSGATPAIDPDSLRVILGLVRGLCSPLAYLHGEGVIHRDLKPDNVLVRPDGGVVLLDFGLTSRFGRDVAREDVETSGEPVGSEAYRAPEQGMGQLVDARADIYALGVMLFVLLTGRLPFPTRDAVRRPDGIPAAPSALVDGIGSELDHLVGRLLRRDPRERPGYAEDVAAFLADLGGAVAKAAPGGNRPYLYRPGLVGRDGELREMERLLDGLERGRGAFRVVEGEPGVGKTRFVMEVARLARERGIAVIAGSCGPATAGGAAALEPMRGLLQVLADRSRARGARETARLFGPGGQRAAILAPFAPTLRALPGMDGRRTVPELPPDAARARLMSSLAQTLGALVQSEPHLLVIDDVHWSDELGLSFLCLLARGGLLDAAPVLVLATCRSGEATPSCAELSRAPKVATTRLGRLDPPSVDRMVADMLALPAIPPDLEALVARRAEGNPFFVAELLRTAVAEGVLRRDGSGGWSVEPPDADRGLSLPGPLEDLVTRRLASLPADAVLALRAASVHGRRADGRLLARTAGLPEARAARALAQLAAREILEEWSDGAFSFVHDLLREVVYGRMERRARARLHRAAAAGLEELSGRDEEHLATLGHHLLLGGRTSQARACFLAGARAAVARDARQEAERLYRACLSLARPGPERVTVRLELSEVLSRRGGESLARAEVDAALSEARALRNPRLEGEALTRLAALCGETGNLDDAARFLAEGLDLRRRSGDAAWEARSLMLLANVRHQVGLHDEARHLYARAIDIARRTGDRRTEGMSLGNLANLLQQTGDMEGARAHYARALGIARGSADRELLTAHLPNLAAVHLKQGRASEARGLCEEGLGLARATGDRAREALLLASLASVNQHEGRMEEALGLYEQALRTTREVGDRTTEGMILGSMGQCFQHQGRLEEAEACLLQALARAREARCRAWESVHLVDLGALDAERGDGVRSAERYAEGLHIARDVGQRRAEGGALLGLATLARREGQLGEARARVEEALRIFEEMGDGVQAALCLCERGHQSLAEGLDAGPSLEEATARVASGASGADLAAAMRRLRRAMESAASGLGAVKGETAPESALR